MNKSLSKIAPLVLLLAGTPAPGGAEEFYQPRSDLERQVYAILDGYCARCHQVGKSVNMPPRGAKHFGNVLHLDEIAADPYLIVPGRPDDSLLIRWLVHEGMALESPSPAEVETLKAWIASLPK